MYQTNLAELIRRLETETPLTQYRAKCSFDPQATWLENTLPQTKIVVLLVLHGDRPRDIAVDQRS